MQKLFIVVVSFDGAPLLLIIRLHEVDDFLHFAELRHELALLSLCLSDSLRQ